MNPDYRMTREGQLLLHRWRRLNDWSRYSLPHEPKSKKATRESERVAIQQSIHKQMRKRNRRSYRGRIAIQLTCSATMKNPPDVHTATKNILDLLAKPVPASGIRRKALIYQDDAQIAYLAVRYYSESDEPQIAIQVAPFRDVKADLALLDFLGIEESRWADRSEAEMEEDARESYKDLKDNKDRYASVMGGEAYEAWLRMERETLQKSFLGHGCLTLNDVALLYREPSGQTKYGRAELDDLSWVRTLSRQAQQFIYDSPFRFKLSHVPLREGEKKHFKDNLRGSLMRFKERFRLMAPLQCPVFFEVIYRPPGRRGNFYKDLDNLMRLIVPKFYETLQPPRWPQGFEVLELPTEPGCDADGFVIVGLTPAFDGIETIWDRLERSIQLSDASH